MLIVGIGNKYRGDDGVGPWVAQKLKECELPEHVKIVEQCCDGAELIELWKNTDTVIVIDAVQTQSPAGTLHRIEAHHEEVPGDFFHYSTHAFSLAEAIELSKVLGELPANLIIYGIAGENFAMGAEIHGTVKQTAHALVAQLVAEIKSKEN